MDFQCEQADQRCRNAAGSPTKNVAAARIAIVLRLIRMTGLYKVCRTDSCYLLASLASSTNIIPSAMVFCPFTSGLPALPFGKKDWFDSSWRYSSRLTR